MTTDLLDFPALDEPPPPVAAPVPAPVAVVKPAAVAAVAPSIKETVLAQFKEAEAGLLVLAEKYRAVAFDVKTTKGMAEAVAARADLRDNGRLALTRAETRVKKDVNDLKKVMGDEVDRLVAIVKPVEDAIDAQIQAELKRKADEKAERERIESDRVAGHQERMAKIGGYLTHCQQPGMTAARIEAGIIKLAAAKFGPEWQEFAVPAADLQCRTLEAMRNLHAAAVEREAEAERLEAQRIEQARVAEQQAEAQRQLDAQAAAVAANVARVTGLQARIAEIHAAATGHEHATPTMLREAAFAVASLDVSEAVYQEFAAQAQAAKDMTIAALDRLCDAAMKRQADAKAAAEAVELELAKIASIALDPSVKVTCDTGLLTAGFEVPTAQPGVQTPVAQGEVAGNLVQPQPGATFTRGDEAAEVGAVAIPQAQACATVARSVTLAECQAALADACSLLEGWIITKCPKKHTAEHFAHVAKLRDMGGIPRSTN